MNKKKNNKNITVSIINTSVFNEEESLFTPCDNCNEPFWAETFYDTSEHLCEQCTQYTIMDKDMYTMT